MGQFGIGQPVRRFEDRRLLDRLRAVSARCRCPVRRTGMCCARRMRMPHPRDRSGGGAGGARRAGDLYRRGPGGGRARHDGRAVPEETAGRLADVLAGASRAGRGAGALCRRAGGVRRRRDRGRGARCRRTDRHRLRDTAVRNRHGAGRRGENPGLGRMPGQHLEPVRDRRQGGDRCRLRARRACRQAALRDQPGLRAFHGAARRRGCLGPRRGPLYALCRRPVPASRPAGARDAHLQGAGEPYPGHCRGCRRRVRDEGLAVPRAPARAVRREAAAPSGALGVRQERGGARRRARARQCQRRRVGVGRDGRFPGAAGPDAGQCRRVHLIRAQPARDVQQCRHVDRGLRHPGGACLGAVGDGEHERHRALSRRRAARGDLCHRAADR